MNELIFGSVTYYGDETRSNDYKWMFVRLVFISFFFLISRSFKFNENLFNSERNVEKCRKLQRENDDQNLFIFSLQSIGFF